MEAPWPDALSGALDAGDAGDRDRDALAGALDEGVRRGVITAAQRASLLAIADARAAARDARLDAHLDALEPRDAAGRHRLSAVAVAYWLGAALVVLALAWLVGDRWERLGPAGVLAVVAAYGVAFAVASWRLAVAGLRFAAGAALALVVATVPVVAWSLLRLTGEWPVAPEPLLFYEPYAASRRLVVSLSTVLAVLVSLRVTSPARVRRIALGAPLAVALAFALVDLGGALVPPELGWVVRPWTTLVAAATLFVVAHAVDRATARAAARGESEEDFAGWLYPASAVVLHFALLDAWSQLGAGRHALVLLGVALLGAALALGRRWLLLFGAIDVVWYLGWLASELFRDTLGFPFVLAGVGTAVIALTVLAQRRFPALLRQAGAARRRGELPRLPGGWLTAGAPLVVALVLLAAQLPRARARAAEREREEWRARRAAAPAPPRGAR